MKQDISDLLGEPHGAVIVDFDITAFLKRYAIQELPSKVADELIVRHHYTHRAPNSSYRYGLYRNGQIRGVCTFGTPGSRGVQVSACKSNPSAVIELNRLWVADSEPRNTESYFVARCLKLLPAFIVVSYADTAAGHAGIIYRACNFEYAGWTDMDRHGPQDTKVRLRRPWQALARRLPQW